MCESTSLEGCPTGSEPEVLYRSSGGALSFCTSCQNFGITFGTLHLNLGAEAVLALGQLLERLAAVELEAGQCHAVRLGGTPATLLLSRRQLTGLRRIVRQGQRPALSACAAAEAAQRISSSEAWLH